MKLSALDDYDSGLLDYVERYINDGSPSGFTLHNQLSERTNPLGLEPFFVPLIPERPVPLTHFRSRFLIPRRQTEQYLIHPDMKPAAERLGVKVVRHPEIRLVPTSSGRTARCIEPDLGVYYKFHFGGVLGRVHRALPRFKVVAGVEVSDEIVDLIQTDLTPDRFGIMPEVCAIVGSLGQGDTEEWGVVVRETTPYPKVVQRDSLILPLFCLFSRDRLSPLDKPLLIQLCKHDLSAAVGLVKDISMTCAEVFVLLASKRGLLYEMNAQNVLIEVSRDFRLRRVLLRDFNSTEKDLTIRRSLNLPLAFESGRYKCLSNDEHSEYYQIRHSFAFDFKLCTYIIQPLIETIRKTNATEAQELIDGIRVDVEHHLSGLPVGFFPPNGVWYSHPEVDLSVDRPYLQNLNPYLRRTE